MTAPETEGPKRLIDPHAPAERGPSLRGFAHTASSLRDAALVLIAISYGLGYLTWATFAAAHDLGPVPALEADYVMTGLLPLLLLALVYPVARALLLFRGWMKGEPTPRTLATGKALIYVAGVLVLASLPIKWILGDDAYGWTLGVSFALWIVGGVISRGRGDPFLKGMALFVLWYGVVLAVVVGLVGYWEKIFARWPQELGGPRPRCVVYDVDVAKLSPALRAAMLGPHADSTGIREARPLHAIFAAGDFVLLKDGSGPLLPHEPVLRVPKGALGAERRCAETSSARTTR